MTRRRRTYEEWRAERQQARAWVVLVDRAFGPYRRERPRDADEAELLRELGTPERLIGPARRDRDE